MQTHFQDRATKTDAAAPKKLSVDGDGRQRTEVLVNGAPHPTKPGFEWDAFNQFYVNTTTGRILPRSA